MSSGKFTILSLPYPSWSRGDVFTNLLFRFLLKKGQLPEDQHLTGAMPPRRSHRPGPLPLLSLI